MTNTTDLVELRKAAADLEQMATATMAAVDEYNEKHGTHIGGPIFFKLGKTIAKTRAVLSQQPKDTTEDDVERVAQAIRDPAPLIGEINVGERITAWQARAALDAGAVEALRKERSQSSYPDRVTIRGGWAIRKAL